METTKCAHQDTMARVLHALMETVVHVVHMSGEAAYVAHAQVGIARNFPVILNIVAEWQKLQWIP